ncbi:MAG: hypothetical protein JSV49_02230 [Thermoplasmata archaeon]|nr:MAG: hypothetical protein JSV49_02230 [Thermoplasmata archaeon]
METTKILSKEFGWKDLDTIRHNLKIGLVFFPIIVVGIVFFIYKDQLDFWVMLICAVISLSFLYGLIIYAFRVTKYEAGFVEKEFDREFEGQIIKYLDQNFRHEEQLDYIEQVKNVRFLCRGYIDSESGLKIIIIVLLPANTIPFLRIRVGEIDDRNMINAREIIKNIEFEYTKYQKK